MMNQMKVIGLTGTIGSGKETVKEILKEKTGAFYVTLSDVIRKEMEKNSADRKTLQDMGNHLRKNFGLHILTELAVKSIPEETNVVIIDGIRNSGEVEFLRKKFKNDFKLLAIDAHEKIRFERTVKRNEIRDVKSFEEFKIWDERDKGKGEPEFGQHVGECMSRADYTIQNDGSLEELKEKINSFISMI